MIMKKILLIILLLSAALPVLYASDHGWAVNPRDFRYDMTIYGTVYVDCESIEDMSKVVVGAFVGDECRGISKTMSYNGRKYVYLRIYGNQSNGEILSFRMWNSETGKVHACTTMYLEFVSLKLFGYPSTPLVLNFDSNGEYSFPYKEDFNAGVMPAGWQILEGENSTSNEDYWRVGKLWDTAKTNSALFISDYSVTTYSIQRLKTPAFNLSKYKKAQLSFDYHNFLQEFKLLYRTSPSSPWKELRTLPRQLEMSFENSYDIAIEKPVHITIDLPELSDEYEIAFDAKGRNGSNYFLIWNVASIDNIVIDVEKETPHLPITYPTGDVNGNGALSIADVVALIAFLRGNPQPTFIENMADVDGNGNISFRDVRALVEKIISTR